MAIRKIEFEFTCGNCSKKGGTSTSTISTFDGNVLTSLKDANLLPGGWISIEWLDRFTDASSHFAGEKDGADFCCAKCVVEYFSKKIKQ